MIAGVEDKRYFKDQKQFSYYIFRSVRQNKEFVRLGDQPGVEVIQVRDMQDPGVVQLNAHQTKTMKFYISLKETSDNELALSQQ